MKKILSIALSVMLLLSTMSVLMLLPASATQSVPVNLITNGDASMGTWTDNEYASAEYGTEDWGLIVGDNPYGWRTSGYNTATNAAYSNGALYHYDRGVFAAKYSSNGKSPSIRANKWNQTMQDIKLEADKAYTVSADVTFVPVLNTTNYTANFDIQISNYAGKFIDTKTNKFSAVTNKSYDLCDSGDSVYNELYINTATEGFPTFTYDDATYWDFGDFKNYSFTFQANDVINDYGLTADSDGYYSATLVFANNSSLVMLMDNITVYEVAGIFSDEGGYITGDTDAVTGDVFTVTAHPYYGNTFLGWYTEDGLVSSDITYSGTLAKNLTAKFNAYNQIPDGSFEANNGAALSYFNSKHTAENGGKNTVAAVPTGSAASHGSYALYCAPATASHTNCDLVCMPVTVEKNKDYAFHFSFYSVTETDYASYVSLHSEEKFTDGWTASAIPAKWSVYANAENADAYTSYKFRGNISASSVTRLQPQIWQNYIHDDWTDFYFVFNSGEDASIFAENETTATVWLTFGVGNSATNTYYIDNVSFTEVTASEFTDLKVVSGENGSITPAKTENTLMPTNYFDLSGGNYGYTATTDNCLVAGSTRYPQMATAKTYTATADYGYTFDGWYDENDVLVSEDATETFNTNGTYTAKFVEGSICDKGGYVTFGDNDTVTAHPYYGNTFLGWYQDDVLKSTDDTIASSLRYVAKFGYNNQINDGDFSVGHGLDLWNGVKLSAMTFTNTTGMDDSYGLKATTKSDALMSAKMPVTVKKDTTYVMSYNMKINSYAPTGTSTPVYGMMVAGSTTGANTWGYWPKLEYYDIIIRSAEDHSKFIKFEKYNSIQNYQMHLNKIVAACGTGWLEVMVEFGTGHDTTTSSDGNMFAESDTATFYMAMGTNKCSTDIDYDNFSFYEKKDVDYNGKENVRAERIGLGPVAAGLDYSFKLLHDDAVSVNTVKFNGQDVTAQDGIYTVTLADNNEIAVTASNDNDYPTAGKDFDGNPLDKWNIPLYNIPVWEGDTVYQENVLFYPGRTNAKLLYPIDSIVSVRSYDLETYYVKGVDFDIVDGEFVLLDGTSIPVFPTAPLLYEGDEGYENGKTSDTEGVKVTRYWEYDTCNYYLSITYTHSEKWAEGEGYQGTAQQSLINELPSIKEKLENGEDVHIVFYGDSMTSGMSASGGLYDVYDTTNSGSTVPYGWWLPPFTPNWMTMFVEGLKAVYPDSEITWENLSLGGQTADWGDKNIAARYKLLEKEPDLFLIGYSINDDGKQNVTKDAFKASTAGIIEFMKETKADTSILLYGGNAVNDNINIYEQATEKIFADALYELGDEYDDVAATSLTDICLDVDKSKETCDHSADNGVHSNDFGCRLYAQTMLAAMTPSKTDISNGGDFEDENVPVDNVVILGGDVTSAQMVGYTDTDKEDAGYDAAVMGNSYLKVTTDSKANVKLPFQLGSGKYLAHLKLKTDNEIDISSAAGGTLYVSKAKNDIVSVPAGSADDTCGYCYNTYGRFVDVYVVIDSASAQSTYININTTGTLSIDALSVVDTATLAPTMVGAQIEAAETPDAIYYVTEVNIPNYVAISRVSTFVMSKHILDTKYPDRVSDFDSKTIPECGYVSVRGDYKTGWVVMNDEGTEVVRSGNLYSRLEGISALNQNAQFSSRSEIEISDNYGNSLGIVLSTANDATDDKPIAKGVHTRTFNQMRRVIARAYIRDKGMTELAETMITAITGKALWNCDLTEVWNFALEASKK